ncbi:MAG: hypothetical protein EBS55_09990 [Flavobacteriaceae bacterium]|nr:hypothetical protein [Flavobacteriaceae bacterium]
MKNYKLKNLRKLFPVYLFRTLFYKNSYPSESIGIHDTTRNKFHLLHAEWIGKQHPKIITTFFILFSLFFTGNAFGQIAQRGSTTTATISTTSVTVNKPTGVVQNDVLILNLEQSGNTTTDPTSSGWTLIDGAVVDSGGKLRRQAVMYKVAGGSEPASYSFTLGTGVNSGAAAIMAFSGVNVTSGYLVGGVAGGPFDVVPGTINTATSAGTTATATAITTATPNAAVIMLAAMMDGTSGAAFSGWTTTSPGSLTEINDYLGGSESIGCA